MFPDRSTAPTPEERPVLSKTERERRPTRYLQPSLPKPQRGPFSHYAILAQKQTGQGYTGEKGIGFKSVFKLANRAHIRSYLYYFQRDQTRDLGIITPQWDEEFFDDHKQEHQTTIILDGICGNSRHFSTTLEKEVNAIDPVLLLFLRRIERLHLTLYKSTTNGKALISKCFRRMNWIPGSGVVSLVDEKTNTRCHFYKHQFCSHFSGTEIRRQGITETVIVLAFPVFKTSGSYVPWIRTQNLAYAYLPLGDFGFKVRYIAIARTLLLILCTVCYPSRFSHHVKSPISR
jgi:hypothetical protein